MKAEKPMKTKRARKKGTVWIRLGMLLIAAALCLAAYNVVDSIRAMLAADATVSQMQIPDDPIPAEGRRIGEGDNEIEYPRYKLHPEIDMPTVNIKGRDYVGMLSVPVLSKWLPVLDQWDYSGLKIGPCRYAGTAYQDNLVICAHNYRGHFGKLKNLRYGDIVTFKDMDGNVFHYKVANIETLQPTAVEDMVSGDWDLTLFTCTLGGRSRVTIRCERIA